MSNPSDLYLSPKQQDLLMAALTSNQPKSTGGRTNTSAPSSGRLDMSDESPYLDFSLDGQIDDSYNYADGKMFGDLPEDDDEDDDEDNEPTTGNLHDKRKSMDGKDDDDEGGGKRREGEDKTAKKPGRKPLTSEPTTKRKAQNRAAQRAFRERKEKHLKDLETKVEELEKSSDATAHENGLLKAQVERLQVELREYRKRLSWIGNNGLNRSNSGSQSRISSGTNGQSDFHFQFPKFGDSPTPGLFSGAGQKSTQSQTESQRNASIASASPAQSTLSRSSFSNATTANQQRASSIGNSPANNNSNNFTASPGMYAPQNRAANSVDSLNGLFSPSILEATRNSPAGYFGLNEAPAPTTGLTNFDQSYSSVPGLYSGSSISTTESPSSSSESHPQLSSIGTSPDPTFNSPSHKLDGIGLNTINEESSNTFNSATWNVNPDFSTTFDSNSFNFLAQQNGGGFDPVLFNDYRDPSDNFGSQDFGSFFNEAYPLPDLGSPNHNFGDFNVQNNTQNNASDSQSKPEPAKKNEVAVVSAPAPAEAPKMMTCNKIWDRLQSMEKFRNGEIDIDNLCSELRAKAKCSEGGAVVEEKHVNKILGL